MTKDSPCAFRTKTHMAIAFKELMNSKPFDKITVSDITEKCNIHRQTFYYHFQDRYELLDWIILNELFEPFVKDLTFNNMYEKFTVLLETILKNKRFYQNAFRISSGGISSYLGRVSRSHFLEVLKSLGREKHIEPQSEENEMLIAEFFGYGLTGIVMSWVQRGMKESPEELTLKVKNLIEVCSKLSF